MFKGDKICKISKIFILKKYFSIWSSEKSTPKTGFLNSCYNLRSIYLCVLPRKSVWSKSNWKVFKGDKICKVSKVFIFKSGFSIWSSKKSTPQPGFLNSCYNLRSIYTCVLPRKSDRSKSNWKMFKGDKICKISKIFIFKSDFSIWSSTKSTPSTWVFELLL